MKTQAYYHIQSDAMTGAEEAQNTGYNTSHDVSGQQYQQINEQYRMLSKIYSYLKEKKRDNISI